MNAKTFFEAFEAATNEKDIIRRVRTDMRGLITGIAVAEDQYALRWQKRDRQAKKFKVRLLEKLALLEQS